MNKLVKLLKSYNLTISAYESITGGLFSKSITDIPGSSNIFPGSIVTYSTEVKIKLGRVNPYIVEKFGVVSKETADEMAIQCVNKFKTDITISFTGNAGPDALENKSVGVVFSSVYFLNQIYSFEFKLNQSWTRIKIRNSIIKKMTKNILLIVEGNLKLKN